MAKVIFHQYKHRDGTVGLSQWHIYCPGCKHIHAISPNVHSFNGDFENPSFTPSLVSDFSPNHEKRCHCFITDGRIIFLEDCYHQLKRANR
jgi:hypothetical protein